MSPALLAGAAPQLAVTRLDRVLYTLLTGRPPWGGRRLPDILTQVLGAAPARPPSSLRHDLPASLNQLCLKCLAKRPAERYPTVQEVRSELIGIIGGRS
jgi:eukaryotic-like serine/threonine-protein kinase